MPIYEFLCYPCDYRMEEIRRLGDYESPICSNCSTPMEHIVSAPAMHIWDQSRKFPNVGNLGDGSMSFDSKDAYRLHLEENHMAESATDAPKKVKCGATVTVY